MDAARNPTSEGAREGSEVPPGAFRFLRVLPSTEVPPGEEELFYLSGKSASPEDLGPRWLLLAPRLHRSREEGFLLRGKEVLGKSRQEGPLQGKLFPWGTPQGEDTEAPEGLWTIRGISLLETTSPLGRYLTSRLPLEEVTLLLQGLGEDLVLLMAALREALREDLPLKRTFSEDSLEVLLYLLIFDELLAAPEAREGIPASWWIPLVVKEALASLEALVPALLALEVGETLYPLRGLS